MVSAARPLLCCATTLSKTTGPFKRGRPCKAKGPVVGSGRKTTCRRETVQATLDERTMSLKLRVPTVDTCSAPNENDACTLLGTVKLQRAVGNGGSCSWTAHPAVACASCRWTSLATCTSRWRPSSLDTRSVYAERRLSSWWLPSRQAHSVSAGTCASLQTAMPPVVRTRCCMRVCVSYRSRTADAVALRETLSIDSTMMRTITSVLRAASASSGAGGPETEHVAPCGGMLGAGRAPTCGARAVTCCRGLKGTRRAATGRSFGVRRRVRRRTSSSAESKACGSLACSAGCPGCPCRAGASACPLASALFCTRACGSLARRAGCPGASCPPPAATGGNSARPSTMGLSAWAEPAGSGRSECSLLPDRRETGTLRPLPPRARARWRRPRLPPRPCGASRRLRPAACPKPLCAAPLAPPPRRAPQFRVGLPQRQKIQRKTHFEQF